MIRTRARTHARTHARTLAQVKLMMGLLEPTTGIIQRDLGARFALVNQARISHVA